MGGKKRTVFHEVIKSEEHFNEIQEKSICGPIAIIDCHLDWCGPCAPMVPNYAQLFFSYEDPDNRLNFFQYPESNMSDEMKERMNLSIIPRFIVLANGAQVSEISGAHYVELVSAIDKNIPEGPED